MGVIFTSVLLEWRKKLKCYVITTNHKNGVWEGSHSGARIYPVNSIDSLTENKIKTSMSFVHTTWGNGEPTAVYKTREIMIEHLRKMYNCEVTIKEDQL